ncbi:MAG: ArsR/SmtB family transcription factor [Bacillota bacterium]
MKNVEIFKALADENRGRILYLLLNKELCVCEIETILDMSQSNVSRHLSKLKEAGIVTIKKDSQWVYYRIDESFKKANGKLYEYLTEKSSVENEDAKKLDMYISCGYTCHQIKKDRTNIIKNISK